MVVLKYVHEFFEFLLLIGEVCVFSHGIWIDLSDLLLTIQKE